MTVPDHLNLPAFTDECIPVAAKAPNTSVTERVARAMLADELNRLPGKKRDFEAVWDDEKEVWLANASAAISSMPALEEEEQVFRAGYKAGFDARGHYFHMPTVEEAWNYHLTSTREGLSTGGEEV